MLFSSKRVTDKINSEKFVKTWSHGQTSSTSTNFTASTSRMPGTVRHSSIKPASPSRRPSCAVQTLPTRLTDCSLKAVGRRGPLRGSGGEGGQRAATQRSLVGLPFNLSQNGGLMKGEARRRDWKGQKESCRTDWKHASLRRGVNTKLPWVSITEDNISSKPKITQDVTGKER